MPPRVFVLFITIGCGPALSAQDVERALAQPEGPEASEEEGPPRLEAEFVASTIFQGATLAIGTRWPLTFESHFFGVEESEIGMVGLGWTFSRRGLRVVPGVAWSFASDGRPAPVVTVRWSYENPRWITQGLWVQSLREHLPDTADEDEAEEDDEQVRYAGILDGVHVSALVGRWEIGALIEHVRHREEREWKGGARVAWRAVEGLKLVGQVLGPGAEVRGGLVWER